MNKLQFRLNINCDNDAFAEDPLTELARILRVVANRIDGSSASFDQTIRDINGNAVGRFAFEPVEPPAS